MKKLQIWLRINAAFSALSGLTLLLANAPLQKLMGISQADILPGLGLNLLVFAAFVAWVSYRKAHQRGWVMSITLMDLAWVLGSALLLIFRPFDLSTWGYILIFIVADLVGTFAWMQYRGMQIMETA
ncbi:MAG: hypothetical protein AAFV07_00145 [Bacteroidota bacterium]